MPERSERNGYKDGKKIFDRYQEWRQKAASCFLRDPDVEEELLRMEDDEGKLEDAFYRDLAFGTGGLRGLIGAGTNRMNIYTVAKASQGLAYHVRKNFPPDKRRIAVSYDSRIKSDLFARTAYMVFAALLICEMYAYYARQGVSLMEKLNEIYDTCGYALNTLHSYGFAGAAGMEMMKEIMGRFRENTVELYGRKIDSLMDYSKSLDGLPASDVLKYCLEDGSTVVIRPSGTEPKLKVRVVFCGHFQFLPCFGLEKPDP